jgi:hypothetical protein
MTYTKVMQARLQPGQAVDVLNERVRHISKLNNAVADWIKVFVAGSFDSHGR